MDETFFCDECGKEVAIEKATERGPMDLLCPLCAERMEYDDEDGTLES